MMDREKVIKAFEHCIDDECDGCPYYDEEVPDCDYFGICHRENLMQDALIILKDRTKDYVEWAKQIGVHTCATCKRRDCDCPIENKYALPMDGHCHLWDGRSTE